MVKTIVRNYHWAPNVVGALFIDGDDYKGLRYWFEDIEREGKEIDKKIEEAKRTRK